MVWSIISANGRKRLARDAERSRADGDAPRSAFWLVIAYNTIGALDILSTNAAIAAGVGEEANPFMRAAMDSFGADWVLAKLALQGVVSAMVMWFPHRLVLGLFLFGIFSNALIVLNNFHILRVGG